MGASPEGPSDDVGGLDASLRQADGDAADLLDRPADQGVGLCGLDVVFRRFVFGGGVIRAVPDRGHHGEGQHDERDVAMPAVPGAGLVVIEAELVLGRLEAVLDRPAVSFDLDQGLDAGSGGAPGGEEGQIVIGDVAADQETPRP